MILLEWFRERRAEYPYCAAHDNSKGPSDPVKVEGEHISAGAHGTRYYLFRARHLRDAFVAARPAARRKIIFSEIEKVLAP